MDYKELLSLAALGGKSGSKYQNMFSTAASGLGRPKDKPEEVMWDDPFYDAVVSHLGYDVGDKQARFKIVDYLQRSRLMPQDLITQTSIGGKYPNQKKIENVRSIIDNYQAFTPDTTT